MVWWSSWGLVQGSKNGWIGHQNWPMADIEAYWGMVLFNPIEGWQVLPTLLCCPSESSSSCWDPPAQYRATMPTSHCHGHRHQWIHFQHQYMGWHNALCCAGRLDCLIQKTNRTSLVLRSMQYVLVRWFRFISLRTQFVVGINQLSPPSALTFLKLIMRPNMRRAIKCQPPVTSVPLA